MVAEFFGNWILIGKIIEKVIRRWVKRGEADFSLIAAHTKLDIGSSRARKGFCHPMKSMTVGTFNVHLIKAMNLPRWIKGLACNRKRRNRYNLII